MPVDPAALCAGQFEITGTAAPLPGYTDENWRIDTQDGTRYVLKISAGETAIQDTVLAAIAGTRYEAPAVVAAAELDDGRTARLLAWVDGTAFADAGRPPGVARAIGVAAGEIVNALSTLEGGEPAAPRDWDLVNAPDVISANAGAVPSGYRRAIVLDVAGLLGTIDYESLPHQVIHNDLNDDNVLLADGTVVGVIDVGDTLRTARIAEAAIAAAYAMQGQDDPMTAASDLVAGFASVVDVTASEAAVLWPLIMGRLATSVVKSAAGPRDNPHRLKSEAGGWDLLERLHAGDHDAMSAELSAAAGHRVTEDGRRLVERRQRSLSPALSFAYDMPINVVRGAGVHLFDERGRRYLDCVNNVAHVGHAHPVVVETLERQARVLNTNTRYLHEEVLRYAERIAATMPVGLDVVFLVNSGSEANELAVRLVRSATGRYDMACFDGGYHGNTTTLVALSPYKGKTTEPWVHVLPWATEVPPGLPAVAGLLAESIQGSGGQRLPGGGLAEAYSSVRSSGGLVIADEVQTGFGRVGSAFWAFELFDLAPDVVTLGKPMGNGHPVGAVVTTRDIADALDTEYFNTFGGNPVSAAVANAVLDVIEQEGLQANAAEVGAHLIGELGEIGDEAIVEVRGAGLFVGVELATAELAHDVVGHAMARGVLLSADGVECNVLKIKPPLVFDEQNAETVVAAIGTGVADR